MRVWPETDFNKECILSVSCDLNTTNHNNAGYIFLPFLAILDSLIELLESTVWGLQPHVGVMAANASPLLGAAGLFFHPHYCPQHRRVSATSGDNFVNPCEDQMQLLVLVNLNHTLWWKKNKWPTHNNEYHRVRIMVISETRTHEVVMTGLCLHLCWSLSQIPVSSILYSQWRAWNVKAHTVIFAVKRQCH